VIFWLAASQLFALYVSNFGKYDRTYGALGAVIVALTWLWMTNLALLLGGEIDDTLDALRREKQGLPKVTKERETVERDLETRTGALSGTLAADEHKPSALAKRIGDGLGDLAKDHLELAKIEVGRSVKHGVMDGVAALLGGIVALIGFAMLCATAVVALEPLIEPLWLRMLLMSFVYLLAGGGIAAAFVHKLKEDVPPEMKRTRAQARRTVQALKQEIQHG
jgi:threonine/homoserine/homoserine lactone efflux protein